MAIPRSFLGGINLSGVLQLASSAGTSGQVLTSQGAGATPTWTNVSSSGLTASSYVVQGRLTGDLTVTASTDTVIPFVDDFDPQNWWDATAKQFKPTTSGYYLVTFQVWWSTAAVSNNQTNIQIRKNGNTFAISQSPTNTNEGLFQNATKLVYLNGSTDYVDFTAYTGNTTSQTLRWGGNSTGQGTFFSASLVTSGANTTSNSLTISSPLSGSSFNGSAAVTLALSSGYGDTQNPYASKTANYILAAPNGSSGVPTFRALAAADIPTLNQNTTGSAATLTTTRTIWGQNFNGSANVTGNLSSVGTITGTSGTTLALSVPSVSTATGTDISITAGSSTYSAGPASAGDISITAGSATSGTSLSSGGSITITAGATNTTNGAGGSVTINAGQGSVANGSGYVTIGSSGTDGVTIGAALTAPNLTTTGGITAGTNVYSGNVLALNGKSATIASQDSGYYFNPAGYGLLTRSGGFPFYIHRYGGSGTYGMVQFVYNGTNNGTINVASGGTPAFASGSDYRIKTDVTPITDALERMKKAKAYTFYKIDEVDPSDTLHTGFLAHELAEVQPDAVLGEKDAVDEDGNPIYQEVMEAKIIPVMAQAISDLIKQNELLVARIEALENR